MKSTSIIVVHNLSNGFEQHIFIMWSVNEAGCRLAGEVGHHHMGLPPLLRLDKVTERVQENLCQSSFLSPLHMTVKAIRNLKCSKLSVILPLNHFFYSL